jgi:AbrB family looped-hinge helix DNA binding protein
MNEQAKITSKGQVTVPLKIRKELGVKPGDSIVFEKDGDTVTVRPLRKESPFAKYRGIGNPGISSGREAVNKFIREIRGFDPEAE